MIIDSVADHGQLLFRKREVRARARAVGGVAILVSARAAFPGSRLIKSASVSNGGPAEMKAGWPVKNLPFPTTF